MFGSTFMFGRTPQATILGKAFCAMNVSENFWQCDCNRKRVKLQSPYHCFIPLFYSVLVSH